MKRRLATLFAILTCGLLTTSVSFAANTGTSAVTLAASANAVLQVLDATMTLTPNAADYSNDFVEVTGGSGLRVRLKSNSSTGCVLYVKCTDASPEIALADFLFKTQTAPGVAGSTISSYTAITASNQALWSTGIAQIAFLEVDTDIRIQNLFAYPEAIGPGTTNYTDNLTYTVVAQLVRRARRLRRESGVSGAVADQAAAPSASTRIRSGTELAESIRVHGVRPHGRIM